MQEPSTVYVVDDDPDMRKSLQRLMDSVNQPVREFATAQEFLDAYDPDSPGCLVLDVRMPGMSGVELQKALASKGFPIPVILVTGHADVAMAVEAMKRGAIDFIEKPFRAQALLDSIQRALGRDAEHRSNKAKHDVLEARLTLLTPREHEVVDLVVTGKTNKQIALLLGVSPQAIDAHRAKAMARLQVDSVAALIRLVLESRIVSVDQQA